MSTGMTVLVLVWSVYNLLTAMTLVDLIENEED